MAHLSELQRSASLERPDMTPDELARHEGVSVRTLERWRMEGTGPPYRKIGSSRNARVRYRVEDYEHRKADQVRQSTAQGLKR